MARKRPPKQRVYKPRLCDECGHPYYRCNATDAWTLQNPGSRIGWGRTKRRVCVPACQPADETAKMMLATGPKGKGK